MKFAIRNKITLAIGSASAFVVVAAAIGFVSTRRLVRVADWVARAHDVRGELRALSRNISAASANSRGFLLTGDSAYYRRNRADVDSADAVLRHLRALAADEPGKQDRLTAMQGLLAERRAAFDRTLALRARPGEVLDAAAGTLAKSERIGSQIDSLLQVADDAEAALLAERSLREVRTARFVELTSAALVITALGLALALWRSIGRDLSGRAKAEAALRASEAKYAGILAIAADAIITVDERQSIVHFNRGAEQLFGYASEEVLGEPLDILLPARHAGSHRGQLASFAADPAAARRMGERRRVRGRRKDGEEFPAEASISKLRTPSGWLFTAMLRDETQRQLREHHDRTLALAGMRLAQTLDYEETVSAVASLPVPSVGVWCTLEIAEEADGSEPVIRRLASHHPDGGVDAALREWEKEPIDWDAPDAAIDVFRTRELLRLQAVSDEWLEAHLAGVRQVEIVRRMGMRSLLVVPLIARERVLGVWTIGSGTDHVFDDHDTALARALAERGALAIDNARLLRRAQRATAARDQVLSVVSHDLRNALSAVSMLGHRLADDAAPPAEHRSIGANILASADWMHQLMQDLLDAASIEAGKLSIEAEPHALHQIVEAVLEMFRPKADSQAITLRTDLPPSPPLVVADATRIMQVFGNLVGNALKFTPAGGAVTIGARESGGEMLVWVRDTGSGIPAADLPRVFDRFWHARRNSAARGTGLGLAIAQGIVHAHGGRIWVESVAGEGSTFYFTLPLARPSFLPRIPLEATAG